MIDWLTLRLPAEHVPPAAWELIRDRAGRVLCLDADGSVEWETLRWECLRSDSHRVHVRAGSCLEIVGSPARAMGRHNVFGSDDLAECAGAMVRLVSAVLELELPPVGEPWACTRVDVAENYDLGDLPAVLTALNWLRYAEGGRYRGRSAASSVYWGVRSSRLSGKAYAKGPHQRHQAARGDVELSEPELAACDRLLRLEVSLRRNYLRACDVWSLSPDDLARVHADYFAPLIGSCEVHSMNTDLLARLSAVAPSEGQALAAWRTLALVSQLGPETAAASMPARTWYRHRALLLRAGLSLADLRAGHVVPLRARRLVLGEPVQSFAALLAA